MGILAAMHTPTPDEHIANHRLLRSEADRESFRLRGGVPKRLPDLPQEPAVLIYFYSNLDKLDLQEEPDMFGRVLREPCGGLDLVKVKQLWNLENIEVLHPTPQSFMAMNLGPNRHFLPHETVYSLLAHDGWISITEGPLSADVMYQRKLRNAYLCLTTMWNNLNMLSSDITGDVLRWFGFLWVANILSISLREGRKSWRRSTLRKSIRYTSNYFSKAVIPKAHTTAVIASRNIIHILLLVFAGVKFVFENVVFRSFSVTANWMTRAMSPETDEDEYHGEVLKGICRLLAYAGFVWLVLFSSCLLFRLACYHLYY